MVDPPELNYAPSPQRYQAAWAEVNTRIQSRLVIQGSFMTGVVVTLLLGLTPPGGDMADPDAWREAAVILLPLLTLATAMWVRHNDAIIGLLSAFMQHLERLDDPHGGGVVPGWQDSRYGAIDAALKYRRWSDAAFAMVGLAATMPALMLLAHRTLVVPSIAVLPAVAALFGIAGIAMVLLNAHVRARIKDNWIYEGSDGERRWRWRDAPQGANAEEKRKMQRRMVVLMLAAIEVGALAAALDVSWWVVALAALMGCAAPSCARRLVP